jgi:hypothetical protein
MNPSPTPKPWRLDCPAFLRASKTGQTKRLESDLYGRALNERFRNHASPDMTFIWFRFGFLKRSFSASAHPLTIGINRLRLKIEPVWRHSIRMLSDWTPYPLTRRKAFDGYAPRREKKR